MLSRHHETTTIINQRQQQKENIKHMIMLLRTQMSAIETVDHFRNKRL